MLTKGASSNSSNVDWICGLNLTLDEKIFFYYFFFSPETTAPYTLLKSESHKKEKSVAEAEAVSLPKKDPGSVVWGSSERCCCVTLLLSVLPSGQLSAGFIQFCMTIPNSYQ